MKIEIHKEDISFKEIDERLYGFISVNTYKKVRRLQKTLNMIKRLKK